jgi:hypothetical protein
MQRGKAGTPENSVAEHNQNIRFVGRRSYRSRGGVVVRRSQGDGYSPDDPMLDALEQNRTRTRAR